MHSWLRASGTLWAVPVLARLGEVTRLRLILRTSRTTWLWTFAGRGSAIASGPFWTSRSLQGLHCSYSWTFQGRSWDSKKVTWPWHAQVVSSKLVQIGLLRQLWIQLCMASRTLVTHHSWASWTIRTRLWRRPYSAGICHCRGARPSGERQDLHLIEAGSWRSSWRSSWRPCDWLWFSAWCDPRQWIDSIAALSTAGLSSESNHQLDWLERTHGSALFAGCAIRNSSTRSWALPWSSLSHLSHPGSYASLLPSFRGPAEPLSVFFLELAMPLISSFPPLGSL